MQPRVVTRSRAAVCSKGLIRCVWRSVGRSKSEGEVMRMFVNVFSFSKEFEFMAFMREEQGTGKVPFCCAAALRE